MYYGEKLNSISHLVGAVFALMGLGALLTVGIQSRDPLLIFSFTVFGITMVLLYTMSTLYHSFHPPKLKRLFQIFDHVAIYILILGIDAMMADTASLHVLFSSLVDRSKYPDGKIEFRLGQFATSA